MEEDIIRSLVREFKFQHGISPHLVTILVGDDPASKIYSRLKKEAAERVGMRFTIRIFEKGQTTQEITEFIQEKNQDTSVHGIMVQMPTPKDFASKKIIQAIDPGKDVDGLKDQSPFIHPTVSAIYEVLEVALENPKDCILIVGERGMVGRKAKRFLKAKGLIVSGVDQDTKDALKLFKQADIIISATGMAGIVKRNMLKNGVSIIDVGSPKPEAEDAVRTIAKLVTPVPGGVGPMTITELLKNTLAAAEASIKNF